MNEGESHPIYLGTNHVWGTPIPITEDDHCRHLYIIGLTGAGKSRLMENLFLQDVYAGRGAAIIDPHGTSARRVLDHIPTSRTRDVVYFNPADLERPIGINILENVHPDHAHLVAQEIVSAMRSLWSDSWGPRMERILYNAVLALLFQRTATLLGVLRLLVDDAYRRRIIPHILDPVIRAYWEVEYPDMQKQFKQEAISPIQNKVERFLSNVVMRNIFGQKKSAIDFFDLMNSRKIFIGNLAKGEIGETNCNLAGSLLITKFYLAALRRSAIPEKDRIFFSLNVDELHNFATESFDDILTEVRKFRLSFCGAHQFLDQLDRVKRLRSAMLASTGTKIAFRVGGEDADVLRKDFAPWPAEALTDLDNTIAMTKLLKEGQAREPFHLRTYETSPNITLHTGQTRSVRNYSRDNFGTPRAQVEAEISRWMQGVGQNASEATLKRIARTIAPKKTALSKNRG